MDMPSLASVASRTLLALAAGTLLGACNWPHTNPVDPDTPVDITIVGPTEIHGHNQAVDYTFISVPEWHYSAPLWESSSPGVLAVRASGGRFLSVEDGTAVITLHLGPHTAHLRVTVSE